MNSEWKIYTLGNILTSKGYIRGPFGSALRRNELFDFGIPVYEQQHAIYGVRDFRFFVSDEKFQEMKRFETKPNDLIISCSGTIGKVSIIGEIDPKGIISQALLLLRVNTDIVLPQYLQYFFSSKEGYNAIVSRSTGSVQVNISKRADIEQIPILLPSLATQREIAATLSALDDKIAVNTKLNHNLEQMAQAIFKSWFVDFEPFGGVMPDNWEFFNLGDLCVTVTKGTTPTTLKRQFVEKGINFVKAESILDNHSIDFNKLASIDEETNTLLGRSIIQAEDIIFTIAGTLGHFSFVGADILPANTNQAVAIIRVDTSKINPIVLYSFFIGGLHLDFYTRNIQQAVQANLSLTTIKALPLLMPPKETLAEYSAVIEPLFKQISQNNSENQKLTEVRDKLLPRLMSGELTVNG
jgi:type I restriction enzyme S subunit